METVKISQCDENKFPDIPDLRFYRTEWGQHYFDASHCLSQGIPDREYSVEDFFNKFDFFIESLCESNGITKEELIVRDESGTLYLEECLALLFLAYIDKWFGAYMIERIEELVRYGFTISDKFCRFFSETRFGADITPQITG